jgi:hypothetical protein
MNHGQAVEQLAVERYLLDELAPDARDAFEEHLFDCQECSLDLRAGTLFVNGVKTELPKIADRSVVTNKAPLPKASSWLSWLRPAFVTPAFAALLAIVVFQNAVTLPKLRNAANQPRLVPFSHLRPATRGSSHTSLAVDRAHGAAVQVDLPAGFSGITATSYAVELRDGQGKLIWTSTVPAPAQTVDQDQQLSLYIPGARLSNGTYALDIASLDAQGQRTPLEKYLFDIVVSD